MNRLIPLFILVSAVASCNNNDAKVSVENTEVNAKSSLDTPFVQPPIAGVDVPYEMFSFDAEQGDTLFPASGSIISFPAGSIVDKDGQAVRGTIDISYREFRDPVDFFVSGISMDYHQNGVKYLFESSGMLELKASQNGIPVFVNQQKKPAIHLVSKNADTAHNLYVLDTVSRRWVNKGKDVVTDLKKTGDTESKGRFANSDSLGEPEMKPIDANRSLATIKPVKASGKRPVISIEIAPGSVPELMGYNNLKFEIAEEDKNWNQKYSNEEWSDVELAVVKKPDLYEAKFTRYNEKVRFLVRPVFEGADYDEALKDFEVKKTEASQLKRARVAEDKRKKSEMDKQEKELAKTVRTARQAAKQLYKKEKEAFEAKEKVAQEKNRRIEELNALILKRKEERRNNDVNDSITGTIYRRFSIDGFGFWNCDEPVLQNARPLFARFRDKSGKEIILRHLAIVYPNFNGIASYSNWNIMILPNSAHMIWGVYENKMAVLSYENFKKCNIQPGTVEYTFTMDVKELGKDGYAELRKLTVDR